ncbi:ABC transporter permease subunit [Geminicoccaceae bacterium 1502E]|nr:ABC transporter permease subunit [Geminicoccaceae bacterium 1502E]
MPSDASARPQGASAGGRLAALVYGDRSRGLIWQAVAIGLVLLLGWQLFGNASDNLARQNIATGFDYLARPASFVISDKLVPYEPSDSYGRALLVGVLNTVWVSFLACLFGTLVGVVVGILRLSPNPLLSRLMLAYVEALRNTPLLLQLLFWYALLLLMPPVREALRPLPGVFVSNGGLFVPVLHWSAAHLWVGLALLAGILAAFPLTGRIAERALAGGHPPRLWPAVLLAVLGPPLVAALLLQPDLSLDRPELGTFRVSGGGRLTPEFTALLMGLALSSSAGIAEAVRSGIQAVSKGQWEAAEALGLKRSLTMRLVVLPQALRIIVPPLTSIYLSTTKNSSLAIAIGYPDLVSVSNTTMNQTGQAMEAIAIFMAIYLLLSLLTSAFMNWYNARVALRTR